MSGGYFGYNQNRIIDIADDIERVIQQNDSTEINEYGDCIGNGFSPATIERMKEAVAILNKAYRYVREIDYLISGDTSENTFHAILNDEFGELK